MAEAGLDERLVAAVRAGNAEEVRRLLEAGAAPDTADEDGLPLLCAAIAAYDAEVAEELAMGGADPNRLLPDGSTPLLRAIEGGSPAVVSATLAHDPGPRLRGPAGDRALAAARSWYERSRAATGERTRVPDDEFTYVDELVLDGRTVRAGHGAILTELEWGLGILTPVEELADRAVRYPDWEHVDWSSSVWVLASLRRSKETWTEVAALRRHPDPDHRRFAAHVLWSLTLLEDGKVPSYEAETSDLLARWATEETDARVLAAVLRAWSAEHDHPDMVATGLRYTGHPDAEVRAAVPDCVDGTPLAPEARAALLGLVRDADAGVRGAAGAVLGGHLDGSPDVRQALVRLARDPDEGVRWMAAERLSEGDDHAPEVADALAGLLDEEFQLVRIIAAYGLMRHDDPRTPDAYARIGPLEAGYEDDHRWCALGNWGWERRNGSAGTEE
ncbi:HEAT repeat domain-containing protein [Streptomyces sp. SKN60]|uniref:HEAT repeat domain-containing protein n=1 Tax=Streptomyces sp. SKN60 TaxID=2855506 RepID=UPI002248212B|nr:HEAT repeat domain-containing protein [Streptomyces sp. SKN60]MCX2182562.1 HEAT repeat domain-containing protein [Streptomyces sp. SKN60]